MVVVQWVFFAVMLTKTGVSAGFIYYWIRTSATRVPLTIQRGVER